MLILSRIFRSKHLVTIIFLLLVIFLLSYYYFPIIKFDYPVPPGDDSIRHMTISKNIINTGEIIPHEGSLDPPFFHIVVAYLSQISGLTVITVTKLFTPLLAVLSIVSIYFIVKLLFKDKKLALIALVVFALFSPQPDQIYSDGTYLNLMSASFLLIFTISFLPALIKSNKEKINWPPLISFGILSIGTLLTHSLSSVYLLMILFFLVIYLVLFRWSKKTIFNKNILVAGLIILAALPFVWKFYLADTIEKITNFLGLNLLNTSNVLQDNTFSDISPIPNQETYVWLLGSFTILLAFLSLLFIVQYKKDKKIEKIVLVIWFLVLLVGSRSSFFQLPVRFARDMAPVVTVFAAIFVFNIFIRFNSWKKITITVITILLVSTAIITKISVSAKYNGMIRIQNSDEKAMQWIKENTNPEDTILGYPRTIVAGDWGSFIELLTERKTLDGSLCPETGGDPCDQIYNPNSDISKKYYRDNSVDYVYAGKKILGGFIYKNDIDWTYQDSLNRAIFLEKKSEFFENKNLGKIIIYKVNQDKF